MDPTPPCQSMGEDVSSITLLVFDDPDASEDCTRNVMPKSAVIFKNVQDVHFASTLKEMNFEGETKCDEEKLANAKNLIDFPQFRVDESKIEQLKNYVNEVQVDVIKMLIQENSELIQNEQKIEDVRIAIANHLIPQLMESLKFAVMFGSVEESDFLFPKVDEMTVNSEDWQEARFLAFLQKHHDKTEREIRDSQPNKQIKDYVLLEAKELLKFFDKDGLAAKVENLELMEAKNRNCPLRPQKSEKEYEEYFKENFKKVTHDYSGFEFTGNYKDFTKMYTTTMATKLRLMIKNVPRCIWSTLGSLERLLLLLFLVRTPRDFPLLLDSSPDRKKLTKKIKSEGRQGKNLLLPKDPDWWRRNRLSWSELAKPTRSLDLRL